MNSLRFNAIGNLTNSSVNVAATAKITGVFNENVFTLATARQYLSDEAYKSWSRFGNENYEENFCHFSGEESFGDKFNQIPSNLP